jgi:hypothetical protein
VFVVPVDDSDEVAFGEVRALTGASIAVFVGTGFRPEIDYARDWVLVHELVHLGAPTLVGSRERWFSEGLATYEEPLVRSRAGWLDSEALWRFWGTNLRRGHGQRLGIDLGIDATYWGGAAFFLRADLLIRARTEGRATLVDVLRGWTRHGFTTEQVRSIDAAIAHADAATGVNVLRGLYEEYVIREVPLPVDAWLRELHVGAAGELGAPDVARDALTVRQLKGG